MTENGACCDDVLAADGAIHDDDRIAYLRDHLAAARRALAAGVKLRGYFVGSLLDNFEWQQGNSRRFGVVYVNFKTLERRPKASYRWLAEFISNQRIVTDLRLHEQRATGPNALTQDQPSGSMAACCRRSLGCRSGLRARSAIRD